MARAAQTTARRTLAALLLAATASALQPRLGGAVRPARAAAAQQSSASFASIRRRAPWPVALEGESSAAGAEPSVDGSVAPNVPAIGWPATTPQEKRLRADRLMLDAERAALEAEQLDLQAEQLRLTTALKRGTPIQEAKPAAAPAAPPANAPPAAAAAPPAAESQCAVPEPTKKEPTKKGGPFGGLFGSMGGTEEGKEGDAKEAQSACDTHQPLDAYEPSTLTNLVTRPFPCIGHVRDYGLRHILTLNTNVAMSFVPLFPMCETITFDAY